MINIYDDDQNDAAFDKWRESGVLEGFIFCLGDDGIRWHIVDCNEQDDKDECTSFRCDAKVNLLYGHLHLLFGMTLIAMNRKMKKNA